MKSVAALAVYLALSLPLMIEAAAKEPDRTPVPVYAEVMEFCPHWLWNPEVKSGGRPVFEGSRVKLVVKRPDPWAGREFWIEFAGDGDALAKIGLSFEIGRAYSMSLPRDFLEGQYGFIHEWSVGALTKQPIEIPNGLAFPSPFLPFKEPKQLPEPTTPLQRSQVEGPNRNACPEPAERVRPAGDHP